PAVLDVVDERCRSGTRDERPRRTPAPPTRSQPRYKTRDRERHQQSGVAVPEPHLLDPGSSTDLVERLDKHLRGALLVGRPGPPGERRQRLDHAAQPG